MADQIFIQIPAQYSATDAGNFHVYETDNVADPYKNSLLPTYSLAELITGQQVAISDNTRLVTVKNLADRGLGCAESTSSIRLPLIRMAVQDSSDLQLTEVHIYEATKDYDLSNLPDQGQTNYAHPSLSADFDVTSNRIGLSIMAKNNHGSDTDICVIVTDTLGESWCHFSGSVPAGSYNYFNIPQGLSSPRCGSYGTQAYLQIQVQGFSQSCDHGS